MGGIGCHAIILVSVNLLLIYWVFAEFMLSFRFRINLINTIMSDKSKSSENIEGAYKKS